MSVIYFSKYQGFFKSEILYSIYEKEEGGGGLNAS